MVVLREENPGKERQHKKPDEERVKRETMNSAIGSNEGEEHPDDHKRVEGKTAHWFLSVGEHVRSEPERNSDGPEAKCEPVR
jgi:hypothetical protein